MDIDEVVLVWAVSYCFVIIAETGHFLWRKSVMHITKHNNYASLYFKNAYFINLVCVNFPLAAKPPFLMYVVEGDILTSF